MSITACLKRLIIKLNIKLKHEPEPQKKPDDKVNDLGRYNKIYEMLVKDNNDLTGQIAYCFYKKISKFLFGNSLKNMEKDQASKILTIMSIFQKFQELMFIRNLRKML